MNNFKKWSHTDSEGKAYHGGTELNNLAMIKLFEQHQCEFLYQMEQWSKQLGNKHE